MMTKMIVTKIIIVYNFIYLHLFSSIFSVIPVTDTVILQIRRYLIMCKQFKQNERENRIR